MRSAPILAALATLAAAPALAQAPRLVTDPAMCALAPQDAAALGMELTETGFSGAGLSCEFETPIVLDWSEDQTLTRPGYCAKPGLISPLVFVLELPDYAPGVVFVWQQGNDDPAKFTTCPAL